MEDNQEKLHLMILSQASENRVVEKFNHAAKYYDFSAIRTMQDAMNNPCPSLVTIKHKLVTKGEEPIMLNKMLNYMLATTAKVFNITRNLNRSQIPMIAEVLEQEYFYLKLSEVHFVLRQGSMGRLGKLYESLDLSTIVGWFDEYVEQRLTIAEHKSLQKHDGHTHNEKSRLYDGFITKMYIDNENAKQRQITNIAYSMARKMTDEKKYKPDTPIVIQVEGKTIESNTKTTTGKTSKKK
jgi:hypothetical protein